MTRVLVWKELREQWTSAVAVLALSLCILATMFATADAAGIRSEYAITLLFCMTWVFGLIAGVQPFATERESGTLDWLDALPVTRRHLWRAKVAASAGIAAAGIVALFVVTLCVVTFAPNQGARELPLLMLIVAMNGLACGLFGSALARSALMAFVWALAAQTVAGVAFAFGSFPLASAAARSVIVSGIVFVISLAIPAIPLVVSHRRFTRLDRLRGHKSQNSPNDWRALIWLTWRQCRPIWWFVVLSGIFLAVMVPQIAARLWPVFGLVLGAIAGIGTFGADQAGLACRFFGDRRIPPGRYWVAKMAVRFSAVALVLAVYFAIGHLRVLDVTMQNSTNSVEYEVELLREKYEPTLVLFGPIFGFALGQFLGLICRKEAVAVVFAVVIGAGLSLLWMPSLIVGGLYLWQWIGPPLLLIAATRLAVWPWVSGRLATWRPALALTGVVLLATAGTVAGVAYRMIEVPVRSAPFDVAAFEKSLPTPELNEGGRAITLAIAHFRTRLTRVTAEFGENQPNGYEDYKVSGLAQEAITTGKWPADSAEMDRWLDAVLDGPWLGELQAAVRLPLGQVKLGGPMIRPFDYQGVYKGLNAGTLILARSVRRADRGEIEPAFDDLALVLDYCRHLRSNSCGEQFDGAARLEARALELMPTWAAKAADRPEMLRRAIAKLRAHEAGLSPLSEAVKMGYVATLSSVWPNWSQGRSLKDDLNEAVLHVPWEEYRSGHILDALYAGLLRTAESSYPDALRRISTAIPEPGQGAWLSYGWTPPAGDETTARRAERQLYELLVTSVWGRRWVLCGPHTFAVDAAARTRLRAAQLQLALILYQAQNGKPAPDLAVLVPDVLPSLPADPFGDGPYRYRVSAGEKIVWILRSNEDSTYREIAAGEGIVWSNGVDLEDNGGRLNYPATWRFAEWKTGGDILYLVPIVSRSK